MYAIRVGEAGDERLVALAVWSHTGGGHTLLAADWDRSCVCEVAIGLLNEVWKFEISLGINELLRPSTRPW